MSIETIFALLFLLGLTLFLIVNKKNLQLQKILWPFIYFALYKTKLGLKQMDSISKKHPKWINIISIVGVYVGILGIFVISFMLIKNLVDLFMFPKAESGVALVLPFKVKGGFYVPFFYWIISIFVLATIHEFCHGVVARLHNIPIKSSGFAFLGLIVPVIPAAFVEPDQKKMLKQKTMKQLAVYAAGPFSNIVTGFMFLALFLILTIPISSAMISYEGVKVEGYTDNSSAAKLYNLPENATIKKINDVEIINLNNLSNSLKDKKPGETVRVVTTNGTFDVSLGKNPKNESQSYLGVLVSQAQKIKPEFEKKFGTFTAPAIMWLMGLLYWLYVLSVGIGLFNLVPLGPVDGGQMTREIFKKFIKNEKTAMKVQHYVSLFFFLIIMINLVVGFV